jgi:hypothetical protein
MEFNMFESTTSELTRNAMQIAHEERAIAFRHFWAWMLNRSKEPALRKPQLRKWPRIRMRDAVC